MVPGASGSVVGGVLGLGSGPLSYIKTISFEPPRIIRKISICKMIARKRGY